MAPQRSEHLYMASTGQSGNVLSPHYDDMIEPFRDVRLLRMPVPGAAGARVLTLTPASGASERAK
jgi:penicillin amidase